jgi:hypothetical protein
MGLRRERLGALGRMTGGTDLSSCAVPLRDLSACAEGSTRNDL